MKYNIVKESELPNGRRSKYRAIVEAARKLKVGEAFATDTKRAGRNYLKFVLTVAGLKVTVSCRNGLLYVIKKG